MDPDTRSSIPRSSRERHAERASQTQAEMGGGAGRGRGRNMPLAPSFAQLSTYTTNTEQLRGCLGKFVGKHTSEELGGSYWGWMPWWGMMVWRLLAGGSCIGLGVFLALDRLLLVVYLMIASFFMGITFILLAVSTAMYARGRDSIHFSTNALVLHTNAVSYAVCLAPTAVLLAIRANWNVILLVFFPISIFLADVLIMLSRIRLNFLHGLPALIIVNILSITGDGLIRIGLPTLSSIAFHAAHLITSLGCFYLAVSLTQIPWGKCNSQVNHDFDDPPERI